jgi:type III restriction enzyme
MSIINEVRQNVDAWRAFPASQRQVTPETARLLHHWRHYAFGGVPPFFNHLGDDVMKVFRVE